MEKSPGIAGARPCRRSAGGPTEAGHYGAGRRRRSWGKSLRRVPVAQLDSSSGFLIRRSQVRILPGTPSPKTCRSLSHFDRILSNRVGITDRPLGKLGKSREAAQVYRNIGATDATFYLDGIRIGAFREQGHHNDFDIEQEQPIIHVI